MRTQSHFRIGARPCAPRGHGELAQGLALGGGELNR